MSGGGGEERQGLPEPKVTIAHILNLESSIRRTRIVSDVLLALFENRAKLLLIDYRIHRNQTNTPYLKDQVKVIERGGGLESARSPWRCLVNALKLFHPETGGVVASM